MATQKSSDDQRAMVAECARERRSRLARGEQASKAGQASGQVRRGETNVPDNATDTFKPKRDRRAEVARKLSQPKHDTRAEVTRERGRSRPKPRVAHLIAAAQYRPR